MSTPHPKWLPYAIGATIGLVALGILVLGLKLSGPEAEKLSRKEPEKEPKPGKPPPPEGSIPSLARTYKRTLVREAQARFGLRAPVARLAGQIHQESRWNEKAQSKYAGGLAQFTPNTASWIAELYPKELQGQAAPYSANWAIKAMVLYDEYLLNYIKPEGGRKIPQCDHWAMALSAYNGGLANLNKDRSLTESNGADPDRWWSAVQRYTRRSSSAQAENRDYPRKILLNHERLYANNGWTGAVACPDLVSSGT